MIKMNGWLTELEMNVIKKNMMNKNTEKKWPKYDDDVDGGEATENESENLVNALQNNVSLSFENVEEMSEEEKIMFKNILDWLTIIWMSK